MKNSKSKDIVVSYQDLRDTYKSEKYYQLALSRYNSILPLKKSEELARITASLISDGFMDIRPRLKSTYYGFIGFFSKNESELEEFGNLIEQVFEIRGKIRDWGKDRFGVSKGYIIKNSILTRILNKAGVPGGGKVNQEFLIPSWVLIANKKIKSAFLRQLFDCEGSISFDNNRKRWDIRFSTYKSSILSSNCKNFLTNIQSLLREFNINSNILKKEAYIRKRDGLQVIGLYLRIDDKDSINNFCEHIGFGIHRKQRRLERAIK